jgi:sulfite exporter TauE/SafE
MNNNELALFTGLFGSIHCIGMCGPLAFAVPSFHQQKWLLVVDKIIYNLGRIVTYSFLGLLIGLGGRQLWLAGMQNTISIITGALILLAAFSRIFKISLSRKPAFSKFSQAFNRLFGLALQKKYGHFIIGMLNGFLPCGFVYLALAGALNAGSISGSVSYMFWFGLGTFPLMLIATLSSGFAGPIFRRRLNQLVPYFMLFLGVWFVLRGLSLDIPYISPAKASTGVVCE